MSDFDKLVEAIRACLKSGGMLFVCGNGGSAAQAEHLAGELICSGFKCIALNNLAAITAIANDHNYESVFSVQLHALAKEKDMLLVLTTSGLSPSILHALWYARFSGMITAGITGSQEMADCEYQYMLKGNTQQVQELTLIALHLLWEKLLNENRDS